MPTTSTDARTRVPSTKVNQRWRSRPRHGFYGDMTPGRASDHIRPLAEVVRPGTKVVLWLRVSGRTQDRASDSGLDNLDVQEEAVRRAVVEAGGVVTEVVRCTGSGSLDNDRLDRLAYKRWLAAQRARETGAEVIVAATTSRFVRNVSYHSKRWPGQQPTDRDYRALRGPFRGLTLATVVEPDATPAEERSRSIQWGREYKRPRGYAERRAERWPRWKELFDQGLRGRPLARASGVPEKTSRNWCVKNVQAG